MEGAHTEIHTRVSDMDDRTRAGEWATTEYDAPLRGIDEDEVSEVCPAHYTLPFCHFETPFHREG